MHMTQVVAMLMVMMSLGRFKAIEPLVDVELVAAVQELRRNIPRAQGRIRAQQGSRRLRRERVQLGDREAFGASDRGGARSGQSLVQGYFPFVRAAVLKALMIA